MNKTAIAFSTKNRFELSKQSLDPLSIDMPFHLFWVDGSTQKDAIDFLFSKVWTRGSKFTNVTGGADAAIVFGLSKMLADPENFTHVGLCENDVLLDPDWFEPTIALFEKGKADGLEVGAVSARCYEDRILIQRDGYAVMHNLGAGMVIFSRQAAELVLQNFRTGWTSENRCVFAQVSGLDIARWSGFAAQPHITCADWQFDRVLAQHGLVSLALTPAKCQMIGQVPSLEEQGLTLARGPVEARRDDKAFDMLVERTSLIRNGDIKMPDSLFLQNDDGSYTIFPHQIEMLGGGYEGDWQLKWCQGHGPFAWKAAQLKSDYYPPSEHRLPDDLRTFCPTMTVPITGPCALIVSGGATGGKINVADEMTGWEMTLDLTPEGEQGQAMNLAVPGNIGYRNIRLTALTPGVTFYGLSTREPQLIIPSVKFDHSRLPMP